MHNLQFLNISVKGEVRGGAVEEHFCCYPRINFAGIYLISNYGSNAESMY